jgi:transcriptional regulator with XRE-family HTH domain
MPIANERTIVSKDPEFAPRIPSVGFRVLAYVAPDDKQIVDLFIAVAASTLSENISDFRPLMNAPQFRILFLREDEPIEWLPQQLLNAGFASSKLLSKILPYSDWTVPDRVVRAWADNSERVLIADALATKQTLIVRNCALERIEVSYDSVPVLKRLPENQRSHFEIDEVGSFIHWPEADIDLDFDSFRYIADPEWRKKCDAEMVLAEKGFGYAVKGIRELHKLTQADIESRTGVSERQLRRYETEGIKPRVSSLEKLAQAHNLSLNDYLERLAKAVNGTVAIIIPCRDMDQQNELVGWFSCVFTWLNTNSGRPLLLCRRKGSKDRDIWMSDDRECADQSNEQLAFAIRIESEEDFRIVWQFALEQNLIPDTAIGTDRWPSAGYVPATTDFVINKLKQRAKRC